MNGRDFITTNLPFSTSYYNEGKRKLTWAETWVADKKKFTVDDPVERPLKRPQLK